MTLIFDVHVLQTVPPSNLNRDDSGSPKTAHYGGVRRARVSSQAWKRATRSQFADRLSPEKRGVRTLLAASLIARRVQKLAPETANAEAEKLAAVALKGIGLTLEKRRAKKGVEEVDDPGEKTQYLVFFSNEQLDQLAELLVEGEKSAKAFKDVMKGNNGIDLALFGRMVADDAALNVDASVQVAHAISTHAVENEFDFYTAVDDNNVKEDTGAGMMGTIEFNSSVLYRYATVNVDLLAKQLADKSDAIVAAEEFIRAFVESMPTGKQNTFANGTLPDAVVVTARADRGISWVPAFEEPVRTGAEGGHLSGSAVALADYATECASQFASEAEHTWVARVGSRTSALDALAERMPFSNLLEEVRARATAYLEL